MVNLCVVGEGAFGNKHLEALAKIEGVNVSYLIGGIEDQTKIVAQTHDVLNWSCDLNDALISNDVDGFILASPTPLHAEQALQIMRAQKHVLIEIPMADNLADAQKLVALQKQTNVIAMAGHVRRFNPSHQWVHNKIIAGELALQQMQIETHFFRRTNTNAKGEPRSWKDHLLWHHACHSVDLFQYQTGEPIEQYFALQGPIDPNLKIAMDMSIGLKVASDKICTISLSFNNNGPLGSTFRYICDNGTYVAKYDELYDGYGNGIDLTDVAVSNDGIELIDRAFVNAIKTGEEPNASLGQCLATMDVLAKIERCLC